MKVGSWELGVRSWELEVDRKLETANYKLQTTNSKLITGTWVPVLACKTNSGGRVGARGDVPCCTESRSSVG